MATSYSFVGSYRFDSPSAIQKALGELAEVLEDEDIPDPFDAGEIVIDDTEVRFSITGPRPSPWFDHYDTIVETFADHALSGEVAVVCEGETEIYKAGPVR
ncbi:MAG TPA: hypothetical protein VGG74_28325 [Kofleriaceae bacterium]